MAMSKFPISLLLLCSIFLAACGGEAEVDQTPEVQISDDTSAVEIDSILLDKAPELVDTIYNNLQDFFGNSMCRRIRMMNEDFRTYSSNEEFDQILDGAQAILGEMYEDLYSTETRFKNEMKQEYGSPETMSLIQAIDKYADSLLPVAVECGGECAQADFFIDFESIKSPCRLTPSEADDELVEILRRVYGVYGDLRWHNDIGWREWWSMESCWYTFGNDYMYDTFTMICEFERKFPDQFVYRISRTRNELIEKLELVEGDKTQYSRESILSEFNKISVMDCLSSDNKASLSKSIRTIETSNEILFETEPY